MVESVLRFAEAGVKLTSELVAELQGKKTVKQDAVKDGEKVADKLTAEQFGDKVEWEGGIFEALNYGLRADDLANQNSELAHKWAELEKRWNDLKPLADEVQQLLDDAWGSD